MAQAALRHGRAFEAAGLVEKAFAGVDLDKTTVPYREAHQIAYDTYRALHDDHRALIHLMAMKRLDDEATRLATQTSTALMAARFDSANQEAKIQRLRDAERLRIARDALQKAEAERWLALLGAGAAAAILLLTLINLVTLRRSRDKVRAANDDLEITNGALNKALAAKTEFLATTSHEIRTPLNGILGMTQVMLADGTLAAPTRDRLTVVHGAGLTMRGLVDDILDTAKLETGHLSLENAPFDLRATLGGATAMWREQAAAKGLEFRADFDRCPPRVAGDAARVRQIVFNLLSNALKFTATGSVSVSAEAAGDGVRITVADTGIGIPAERQADVFEPFRQADTSTTRRFGGTGLGLSISRNLARAMGGNIRLSSAPGEGTTFTISLPLPAVAPAAAEVPDRAVGPALLIVERNPIARAMFRTLFAGRIDHVRFAATVDEVAACVGAGGVTRLLIDDATAKAAGDPRGFVAAVIAAARGLPVTLLWPVASDGERNGLLALGVADVVAKPVSGALLIAAVFPDSAREDDTRLVSQAA